MAGFGGGAEIIDLSEEDLEELKDLGGRFEQTDLLRAVEDLSNLESRFRQLPSTRVAMEMLLMRMAQAGTDVSIDTLFSRLASLEKRIGKSGGGGLSSSNPGSGPRGMSYVKEAGPSDASSAAPEPAIEPSSDEEEDEPEPADPPDEGEEGESQLGLWSEFLDAVREQRMSTYSFLSSGRFCGIDNGQAIICFDPKNIYNKKNLEEKSVRQLLEETLKNIVGTPTKIKLIIEDKGSGERVQAKKKQPVQGRADEAEKARRQRIEEALKDPVVKKTLEIFKGRIVYTSG